MPVILHGGPLGSGVQAGVAQGPELLRAAERQEELEFRRNLLAQAMEQERVGVESLGEMAQVQGGGILPEVAGTNVATQAGMMATGMALGAPVSRSMYGLDKEAAVLPQADAVLQRAIARGASREVVQAIIEDTEAIRDEIVEQADTAKTVQLLTEWGQIYPEQQQFVDLATGMAGQVPAKDLLREALRGMADSNAQQADMQSRQAFLADSRARREALNDPNHPFRQELLASGVDSFEIDEIVKGLQKKMMTREFERGFDMQQGAPQGQAPAPTAYAPTTPTNPFEARAAQVKQARVQEEFGTSATISGMDGGDRRRLARDARKMVAEIANKPAKAEELVMALAKKFKLGAPDENGNVLPTAELIQFLQFIEKLPEDDKDARQVLRDALGEEAQMSDVSPDELGGGGVTFPKRKGPRGRLSGARGTMGGTRR